MKAQVKTPLAIVVGVLVVGAIAYWGMKLISSTGELDQGQIKYTPGVPPWLEKDPSKRGPGPRSMGNVSSSTQDPALSAAPAGIPVGPPVISSKGKQ